ncbi:MAG: hypothetical protein K0R17_1628 [Rariglobus sp.]|jgi:hypothetical protein|nr:hypothetical protein [Rariglobus sp.]
MKSHASAPRRRRSGFALLITITLLAFLVLLLVSLAALTRVETQVASNNQQLSQARQNALMGLNIALGRLQATAGPDTRITATADIIAGRNIDKKNWTGVWNAAASGADKNIAWLVSGTAPQGSAGVTGALTAASGNALVPLVGANTTDISATVTTGNQVRVESEPIKTTSVPGLDPAASTTVGNFAYWVGDEGVKSKVSLTDPWENPAATTLTATTPATTTAQAQAYRFINAQRTGVEGVDAVDGTKLGGYYPATDPAFKGALDKVMALSQFPLAHADSAGQTALTQTRHNRFHDLTANSYSVLADVAKGGLKKDLTAWIKDTTASNPNPSTPATANDDYLTPGDASDVSKYGLPKWEMIRSFATVTPNAGGAYVPQTQTPSRQGIYPVMTYARIGYNLTCPATGGIYKINIMPVVALWNPYNVPIAKSNFEVCFKYTTSSTSVTNGNYLKLVTYPSPSSGPNPATDSFNLSNISMGGIYYGIGNVAQFWRFKVELSSDLAPGESRLFTIIDPQDNTQYSSGQSTLGDLVVAPNNAVFIPSRNGLSQAQMNGSLFWNTEFGGGSARTEILLTQPVASGITTPAAIEEALRANAYQTFLGNGFDWNWETNPGIVIPPANNGVAIVYQRIELVMSTLPTAYPESYGSVQSGTPRWLANLNPQSSVVIRKPASTLSVTPSYLREHYIRAPSYASPTFVYKPIPNANGVNVSAGTRVSTTGTAQNLVIRELPATDVPLFSIAQLQHVNVSSLNLNPAYAIGNSLPNLYVNRNDPEARSDALGNDIYPGFPNGTFNRIYDLSYLLNKTLWDGYFFSTVPSTLTTAQAGDANYHLPNSRHLFYWKNGAASNAEVPNLKATNTTAANLLVDGGFNINSTSKQAWRALLYSHNGVATDPTDPTSKKHPYSRFAAPAAGAQPNATWLGYRILSDEQIDALAGAIVDQVRLRGPFLSLADFVNRRLAADATGLKGPLQTAIDATINDSATPNDDAINRQSPFTDNSVRVTDYAPDVTGNTEQQTIYMGGTSATEPSGSRASFAPGYLTQADLLTVLGPSLTARSDTFRIRSYGDTVNPATGAIEGRAWCEAIVQRLPDYVETAVNAWSKPTPGSASDTFGRRFKIVTFRWLSSDEI